MMPRSPLDLDEDDVYEQTWDLLMRTNCEVWRLAQKRAAAQTPGLSDLIAFTPDFRLGFIETKRPSGGRQRRMQAQFQACVELVKAPPKYLLVTHPQTVADWIGEKVHR